MLLLFLLFIFVNACDLQNPCRSNRVCCGDTPDATQGTCRRNCNGRFEITTATTTQAPSAYCVNYGGANVCCNPTPNPENGSDCITFYGIRYCDCTGIPTTVQATTTSSNCHLYDGKQYCDCTVSDI